MPDEILFRFGAIREPEASPQRMTEDLRIVCYPAPERSELQRLLAAAPPPDRPTIAQSHLDQIGQRGTTLTAAPALVQVVHERLLERRDRLGATDLIRIVDTHLFEASSQGTDPDEPSDYPKLLASGTLERDRLAYGDTLIAAVTAGGSASVATQVTRILLILGILEWLDDNRTGSANLVAEVLEQAVLLLPPELFPIRLDDAPTAPATPSSDDPTAGLLSQIGRYVTTITALKTLATEPARQRITPLISNNEATFPGPNAQPEDEETSDSWVLNDETISTLPAAERAVLSELSIGAGAPIQTAIDTIRQRAATSYRPAAAMIGTDPARALVDELARRVPTTRPVGTTPPVVSVPGPFLRPPAIGDLNIVRQTLLRYERGEIAHIENVLAKESKRRALTTIDVREEENLEIEENEEERSFDNQTTARNELEKETTKNQQQDEQLNVGGSVSAQYGAWVKATVTAGYAKAGSSSESARNAARYAKDVTDRAASRIRQRTEEVRRRLTRREVTERNTHALTNSDAEHVTGIYRWVDKLYRAQVFNYGKRLLLELVVPDPSVNFRYAAAKGSGLGVGVEPPPPLALPETPDMELQPAMITAYNWSTLAARFRVSGITPPPADLATITLGLVGEPAPPADAAPPTGGSGPNPARTVQPSVYKASRELTIPQGYFPLGWTACVFTPGSGTLPARLGALLAAAPFNTDPAALPAVISILSSLTGSATTLEGLSLAVGPSSVTVGRGATKIRAPFNWGQIPNQPADVLYGSADGPMAVVAASDGAGFALTLTVRCELTTEAFEQWQQRSYEAIVQAHAAWETDYRAAVSAALAAAGVIFGTNPLENAATVRTELKRAAIGLMSPRQPPVDAVVDPGNPAVNREPAVDRSKVVSSGRSIEFWEQSFEWAQMAWMLYPYFWSGRSDWPEASRRSDSDPAFAEFLRAGAARVVLPVRPGFERVVCSTLGLQLPEPWPTSPAPLPNSEPWISISDEIRAATETPAGKPVGKAWKIRIPTTLVILDPAGTDLPILSR